MNSGWAWQIEHDDVVNRGYVYSSRHIADDEADREFREKNPQVDKTRIVKFVSGRYRNAWVKNVVAIGNASGFVEPLESTALHVIAEQLVSTCAALLDSDYRIEPPARQMANRPT